MFPRFFCGPRKFVGMPSGFGLGLLELRPQGRLHFLFNFNEFPNRFIENKHMLVFEVPTSYMPSGFVSTLNVWRHFPASGSWGRKSLSGQKTHDHGVEQGTCHLVTAIFRERELGCAILPEGDALIAKP